MYRMVQGPSRNLGAEWMCGGTRPPNKPAPRTTTDGQFSFDRDANHVDALPAHGQYEPVCVETVGSAGRGIGAAGGAEAKPPS